jgi:hypothetical protein
MFNGTTPAFDADILDLGASFWDPLLALATSARTQTATSFFNDFREFNGGLVVASITLFYVPHSVGGSLVTGPFVTGPGFAGGPGGLDVSFDTLDDPVPVPTPATVPDSASSLWLVLPAMLLIAVKRYKFQGAH